MSNYSDGTYDYLTNPAFTLKWGVILRMITQLKPSSILDLACGCPCLLDYWLESQIARPITLAFRYVGIDKDKDVISVLRHKYLPFRPKYIPLTQDDLNDLNPEEIRFPSYRNNLYPSKPLLPFNVPSFYHKEIQTLPNPLELREQTFSLLLWAGIENLPTEYPSILTHYIPYLTPESYVILDHMDILPVNRTADLPLKIVYSCSLVVPINPPHPKWPQIGHRRITLLKVTF